MPKASRAKKAKSPRYVPILDLPPLDPETYAGLKANIALNGVLVPIVRDEYGHILDGFARCADRRGAGLRVPDGRPGGPLEPEKRSLVRALNLARQATRPGSRRAIIADQLRETPGRSNRWIARGLGVHDKTGPSCGPNCGQLGDPAVGPPRRGRREVATGCRPGRPG